METTEFQSLLAEKSQAVENILKKYLPDEEGHAKTVIEAMNYSLLVGGKRLRPILMQEVYTLFGGKGKVVEPFMAAIEMIHTYSLVHDDLPAMDNDEFRRGRQTTWKAYGEAMGVLAGDGLLNYAFETVLLAFPLEEDLEELAAGGQMNLVADRMQAIARAIDVLVTKSGIHGMIGGQCADIEAEKKENVDTDTLLFIHEHKTAALIQAAMMVGAILAGATRSEVSEIEKCAYNIGVAFQIQDDILDVIGNSEELGKPVGSDEENHKTTYVTQNGLEHSKAEVERMSKEAVKILRKLVGESTFLEQLVISLIDRSK